MDESTIQDIWKRVKENTIYNPT